MLKKNELAVLNLYKRDIFLSSTIRGLSIILKKQYSLVYNAVKTLENQKILTLKEIGKSKVCELSLSPETISILSFLDEQTALSTDLPTMKNLLNYKEFLDDIILIDESYSQEKQKQNLDIEVVIITKEHPLNKQKLIENITSLSLPNIYPIIISQKDFINMLLDKKANFGKEVFYNRLIYRNATRYYELLKEAVERGFKN